MEWRARAYGLTLEGDRVVEGLPLEVEAGIRRAHLSAVSSAELDARWPNEGVTRLAEEHVEPGRPPRTIDHHPVAGWRLDAPHWGLARVAADGSCVECAREDAATWRWERFLLGRALPFAAVAHGFEALHAAAVELDGRVLALTAPTGGGKSSVAAAFALAGAPVFTDDVLAVECGMNEILAHAGPASLALRDSEARRIGPAACARLGEESGAGGGKRYVSTPSLHTAALPLDRVAVLRRSVGPGGGVSVCDLGPPEARLLFGMLFAPELATPERLRDQLDVLASMAHQVRFVEVVAGADATAEDIVKALSE